MNDDNNNIYMELNDNEELTFYFRRKIMHPKDVTHYKKKCTSIVSHSKSRKPHLKIKIWQPWDEISPNLQF